MVDAFNQRSQDFVRWLSAIPGASISSKIALEDLRNRKAGRGVVAVENIDEGEELFTIPRNCILCLENSELLRAIPHVFEELDSWTALILVLMHEYLKGERSLWKPYFDVLPADFDTLMFWSESELEELQASAVRDKIGRASAEELFHSTVLPLWKGNANVFHPNDVSPLSDSDLITLAHRMGSTIMAYAFDLEKDDSQVQVDEDGYATEDEEEAMPKGMIPMADMLNANAVFNAHLFCGQNSFTMRALQPIAKGEEVLNDYGPLPRSDLLRRYGYITPEYAQYDVVEISQELVITCAHKLRPLNEPDLNARLEYLEDKEALEDAYLLGRITEDDADDILPDEIHLLLSVLLAQGDEYKRLKHLAPARKLALAADIQKLIADVLVTRKSQYATSIAEDRALLRDPVIKDRLRAAIEVRLAEKEILEDARQRLAGQHGASATHDNEAGPQQKRRKT